MRRPNILFAFADDWGRYASAYAAYHGERSLSALIDTPHFDRVAGEGVLFTNALVPAPSCTPCRSSILSGRYFWQTGLGAILQGAVWDRAIPSYPFLLREAGYHIGFSYKVWSPGTPQDDPYGGTGTRYQECGNDFNQFSFRATEWAGEAGGVESAKQRLCDEVHDFLYIRNFAPDRWPMGDPRGMDDPSADPPPRAALKHDTRAAYADLDASPTKAWMIENRAADEVRDVYALGFGKRPAEELYDVRSDPDHMRNLAACPAFAVRKRTLVERLQAVLREQGDPRMDAGPCRFETAPFTDWPCPDDTAEQRAALVKETARA